MNLSEIVSKAAPILGGLLVGGPVGGGAAALKVLASEFGVEPDEQKVADAIAKDPNAEVKLRQIEADNRTEWTKLHLEAETAQLREVNKTMREEGHSKDAYVRRWRPTIGYVVASQFFMLGLAVFIGVIGAVLASDAEKTTAIFTGLAALVGALVTIIVAECTVLGVNIKQRSNDKAVAAGMTPAGLLSGLFSKNAAAS